MGQAPLAFVLEISWDRLLALTIVFATSAGALLRAIRMDSYPAAYPRPAAPRRSHVHTGRCVAAMFTLAGVSQPERVIVCDALQAFALQRNSDAVAVMPEPLLGNPETRDIVAIDNTELQPHDLELVMLKPRPRAGLTQCAVFDCKEPSL